MKCDKCSDNCEECFDESYCLKCKDGYKLVLSENNIVCVFNKNEDD